MNNKLIAINTELPDWEAGNYKGVVFNIWKTTNPIKLRINGYQFDCVNLQDAYDQIADRVDNNKGIYSNVLKRPLTTKMLDFFSDSDTLIANMTPVKHAESSAKKWGGTWEDYIELHSWFDETKQYTGDWTHRALRHHSVGVEWAIEKFGHTIVNSKGQHVPTKVLAETHVEEDCGFIPTPKDYLSVLKRNPEKWMLTVGKKSVTIPLEIK